MKSPCRVLLNKCHGGIFIFLVATKNQRFPQKKKSIIHFVSDFQ